MIVVLELGDNRREINETIGRVVPKDAVGFGVVVEFTGDDHFARADEVFVEGDVPGWVALFTVSLPLLYRGF